MKLLNCRVILFSMLGFEAQNGSLSFPCIPALGSYIQNPASADWHIKRGTARHASALLPTPNDPNDIVFSEEYSASQSGTRLGGFVTPLPSPIVCVRGCSSDMRVMSPCFSLERSSFVYYPSFIPSLFESCAYDRPIVGKRCPRSTVASISA